MKEKELELVIPNKDDITLSAELADGRLSLSEIGAIFFIFAITQKKLTDEQVDAWSENFELQAVIQSFIEKGILTMARDEDGLHMKIDLSTYNPNTDDEDWDDDDGLYWDDDIDEEDEL